MGIFSKSKADTADSSSGAGPGSSPVDLEAAKAEIRKSRGRATRRDPQAALEEMAREAEIDRLYESENWEEIAGLYFEARYAITGWEGFRLSDGQKKMLATSLSSTMRILLKIDPRYVAMIVFTVNFGGLVASKELAWKEISKAEKKAGTNGG